MKQNAGLDISLETSSICIVDETGRIVAERKVATCPDAVARELRAGAPGFIRAGMGTGLLAVWFCGELKRRELPILCLDARHANATLEMMPNKTDRNLRGPRAAGCSGWGRARPGPGRAHRLVPAGLHQVAREPHDPGPARGP